ncbi:hypothetical protein [Saccharothrix sp. ST-888]|uniref:hypothetical protein n=1 Tax=Saccharothrix sp. ST-888 TaxID=1427391 RepID=UPI0005ED305C|nr:hypothetical protein [Saccharothrix sp. ST-888]
MLAQVWGLGLGVTSAYAATAEPDTDLVSRADAPALLDGLTGTAAPVLQHPTAPVEQVLQDRIRAGGLPLPGQATTVPDAFAIAAVLLPAVPPQPRGDGVPRASRSNPAETEARPAVGTGVPAQQAAALAADPAAVPSPVAPGGAGTAGAVLAPGAAWPADEAGPLSEQLRDPAQPLTDDGLALTAAAPVEAGDELTAVLVPIAGGMLLTGAAMYKHRGLPRGH